MSSILLDYLRRQYAPPESDAELVRRFLADRKGDAFSVLVRRHGPAVLGLCRRRLDERDADDAFQAVFVTLARKAARLRRPDALAGWLHGVTMRICGNAIVARQRRERAERRSLPQPIADPVQELSARELLTVLDEELERLPDRERLPLLLVYWQGRSQSEAARELGLTSGALRGRLDRGRERLAKQLRQRGYGPGELRSLLLLPTAAASISTQLMARTAAITTSGAAVSAAVATLAIVGTHGAIVPTIGLTMILGTLATVVWLGASTPQAVEKPEQAKAGSPAKDLDGRPIPQGAVMRLGSLRMKHPASEFTTVHSKILPDGNRALTWNRESLHIWDLVQEKSLGEIRFDNPTRFRAMSRNGGLVAFESQKEMVIIDLNTIQIRRTLPALGDQSFRHAAASAFSPDGRWLAWYRDGGLKLWDIESATEMASFTGGLQFAQDLVFTPDGAVLVGNCLDAPDGRKAAIVRWDTKTRTKISEWKISATSPSPRLSRSGDWIAVPEFQPGAIAIKSTITGENRHQLPIDAFDYHFTKDDRQLVAISWTLDQKNYRATVWDVESGKQLSEVSLGRQAGGTNTMSLNGERLLCACLGPMVFNLKTGLWANYGAGHQEPIHRIQFTPDGRTLLTSGGSSSICWDLASGRAIEELSHRGMMKVRSNNDAVLIEPERAALVALPGMRRELRSLEVNYPKQRSGHTWYANDVAVSNDGRHASAYVTSHPYPGVRGGESHAFVHRWDLITGKATAPWPPSAFSPNRFRPNGSDAYGFAARPLPDGANETVDVLVEVGTGRQRIANTVPQDLYLRHSIFSPDGQTIGTMGFVRTGGDDATLTGYHSIALREIRSNQEYLRLRLDDRKPHDLKFGLAGNALLVIPNGSNIEIRNGLGNIVTTFRNVGNVVETIAIRPDRRQMATGHGDGTVLLWDLPEQNKESVAADPALVAQWWEQMKSDPPVAYAAMSNLGKHPDSTVKQLAAKLQPAANVQTAPVKRLVADLENKDFKVRQSASIELAKFIEPCRPLLESFEKEPLGPDSAQKLKQLLDRTDVITDPELLRALRAVELLERIGTAAAKELLKTIAGGAPGHRLTFDAQEAIARLSR